MARPTREDLQSALTGVEPGEYLSSELLPIYLRWAERNDRPSATARELGRALGLETCFERFGSRNGSTVWNVTPDGLECRNWFVPPA